MGWRGLFWFVAPLVLIAGGLSYLYPRSHAKSRAKIGLSGDCGDGHGLCDLDHWALLAG